MVSDQTVFDRIVVARDVMHGKPRIAGTRITVVQILDLLAGGKSPTEIVSDDYYPDITEDDVRACIAYASHMIREDRVISSA